MSNDDDKDENIGQRWYEYKKDNWSRTSVSSGVGKTVGFEIDEKMQDPTYNWTETKETRIEYMDNIEQQYTYFCYGEKDYEACQKRAEFLMNFRQKYELAQEEFVRCCETFKTPGCCNQARMGLLVQNQLKKRTLKNVDFKDYWNYTRTACFAEDYPRSKQQQDHRSTACLALADTLTKLTSFKTESRDTATAQIFNSWPKEHGTKEFKTKLVQKLEQNCNTQCGDRYKSCNFVSAVFLNKRYSDIFQTEINPVKALKYLDVACEGIGPGLGESSACLNLVNIFKRGNTKWGIPSDPQKVQEYSRKAFLITPEGRKEVAMINMPKAGELIS